MASTILSLLLIFSLLSVSSAQTLTRAASFLSVSGYASMSLALNNLIASLNSSSISQLPSLTVFAPSDAAFDSLSGEPSHDLICFHIVPAALPLLSLPLGTTVPTLLSSHSLTVTADGGGGLLYLNNVEVSADPPILDSEDLVIFAVDAFFRCGCPCSAPPRNPSSAAASALIEASEVLKSNGFSYMAAFLDLHFLHDVAVFDRRSALTVFAPVDRAMKRRLIKESSRHAPTVFLRRHVVPWRRLSYSDLESLEEGSRQLMTSDLQGAFVINVTRRDDENDEDGAVVLNGVPVVFPEIYSNGWLVIHGVGEVLGDTGEAEVMRFNNRDFFLIMLSIRFAVWAYCTLLMRLLQ